MHFLLTISLMDVFDNQMFQLGAVEFLRKPLSEDKLRNIWQHVVHKVCLDSSFNSFGLTVILLC